jgi:hypothetical protein
LSFFYGALYGISNGIVGWFLVSGVDVDSLEMLCVLGGIMSAVMGIGLLIMCGSFIGDSTFPGKPNVPRMILLRSLLKSFGKTWYQRLLPVQRDTTLLAWPGVVWDDQVSFA